jgi:hypothetical protein
MNKQSELLNKEDLSLQDLRKVKMEARWRKEFEEFVLSWNKGKHGLEQLRVDHILEMDDYYEDIETQIAWDFYLKARRTGHQIAMISTEAHLTVYHILKNELGKYIDVEKFLDENVEM